MNNELLVEALLKQRPKKTQACISSHLEPSRPKPDSLTPPKAASVAEIIPSLIPTIPVCRAFPTWWIELQNNAVHMSRILGLLENDTFFNNSVIIIYFQTFANIWNQLPSQKHFHQVHQLQHVSAHPPALSHVAAVEVAGQPGPAVVSDVHRLLSWILKFRMKVCHWWSLARCFDHAVCGKGK